MSHPGGVTARCMWRTWLTRASESPCRVDRNIQIRAVNCTLLRPLRGRNETRCALPGVSSALGGLNPRLMAATPHRGQITVPSGPNRNLIRKTSGIKSASVAITNPRRGFHPLRMFCSACHTGSCGDNHGFGPEQHGEPNCGERHAERAGDDGRHATARCGTVSAANSRSPTCTARSSICRAVKTAGRCVVVNEQVSRTVVIPSIMGSRLVVHVPRK